MLADRPRLRWAIEVSALLAIIAFAYFASPVTPTEELDAAAPPTVTATAPAASPSVHDTPDTLIVHLHDVPEWTGIEDESDWAKSYRIVWDGPIRTWTTMRDIRVPSLNHRMIESIEPGRERCGLPSKNSRVIVVKVRVVVPGDLEAALEWVRSNPAVEQANVAY